MEQVKRFPDNRQQPGMLPCGVCTESGCLKANSNETGAGDALGINGDYLKRRYRFRKILLQNKEKIFNNIYIYFLSLF